MIDIVGIKFDNTGKIYDYLANGLELKLGKWCIVEIDKGLECGYVAKPIQYVQKKPTKKPLRKVVRLANDQDGEQIKRNKEMGERAKNICEKKIRDRGLTMKLIKVKYTFDGNKAIFYFTSEGRIDFRDLVKDLASEFKTRIEMKQIGVRDEAKIIGGIGNCGLELCCINFLRDFDPVSIRMAKDQNLTLNPNKISGICGRLMCCLGYEHDIYLQAKTRLPKIGDILILNGEEGRVTSLDILNEIAYIEFPDGRTIKVASPYFKNGKWTKNDRKDINKDHKDGKDHQNIESEKYSY
ncbi:stage 0 sporulation family protein [bacterium]|nr:stage 0 sporulation family protein [bacterium]